MKTLIASLVTVAALVVMVQINGGAGSKQKIEEQRLAQIQKMVQDSDGVTAEQVANQIGVRCRTVAALLNRLADQGQISRHSQPRTDWGFRQPTIYSR